MGIREMFLRGLEERLQDFGFSATESYSEDKKTVKNIYEKRINELFEDIEDRSFLSVEISCTGKNIFLVEFGCLSVPRNESAILSLGCVSMSLSVDSQFDDLDLILRESYKMAKFNYKMGKGN